MRITRVAVGGLSFICALSLLLAWAQPPEQEARDDAPARDRALDPQVFALRLLLGVGDRGVQSWAGSVKLDKGEVLGVEGWRFHAGDRVSGTSAWKASSLQTVATKKAAQKKKKAAVKKAPGAGAPVGPTVPNGVIVTLKAPEDAVLAVETEQGKFEVPLADLAAGASHTYLGGRVEAQRVPPVAALSAGPTQDDFPAAAADSQGALWVAYVAHTPRGPATQAALKERPKKFADYVPTGGGDQVKLVRFANGQPSKPVDVTGEGLDVWRPAVAVNKDGKIVVAWSENKDNNFDLYSREYDPTKAEWTSETTRLTTQPGTDTDPVLAKTPDGQVWLAWQAWLGGQAEILLAPIGKATDAVNLSNSPANEWCPAIAADASGNVYVAYDSYLGGNYDIVLRSRSANGSLSAAIPVAQTSLFEARPNIAADSRGRVWVAYEERTPLWGKDAENMVEGLGSSLYRSSGVRVRCVEGNRVFEAPDPLAGAPAPVRSLNSFPRIACDHSDRVWLAFRHRQEARASGVGGVWVGYATSLAGPNWSTPQIIPRSDGMLDNRPALVAGSNGGPLFAVYSGDNRLRGAGDNVMNRIEVAALVSNTKRDGEPALADVAKKPAEPAAMPVHAREAEDIARMRAHRIAAGGKSYQLLRGEFHRHTEISGDGGNDGALEDMWRYAIDAAGLDWIGNGDHDNGGGKEYTWWLIQKSTDLYHHAPKFNPMFTYERSVVFPHGHRNLMRPVRGMRTLPRLNKEGGGPSDDDTKMLYDYVKELNALCASHTSGTNQMGTDWRDNDPVAEPIVEIFQGHRNSYEHLGAPRVARRASEAIGGFQPYGMIWNAFALNYKLGFQASSDHISTHISYAIALAERPTREAIFEAFQKRHCYAATDNILLEVRSGEHLMGDEFNATGPVRLHVLAQGTGLIGRVDIIKDFAYVFSTEPKLQRVEFDWTDSERREPGTSWYYVRVIQTDGQLAWGSPMWVHSGR